MKSLFKWLADFIYKWTFCRGYSNCIGLCGKKWTDEDKRKAAEQSWQRI